MRLKFYWNYAGRILSIHDEAVSRLTKPKASGKLRIGLIDCFLPELLPSLLSKFRKQYANIHLEVQTDVGINLIPLFEKGALELVVAGKDSYQGSSRVLTQEPLIWVVGRILKHPCTKQYILHYYQHLVVLEKSPQKVLKKLIGNGRSCSRELLL